MAVQFDGLVRPRIDPRSDRGAMQGGEVGTATHQSAKIAGQGADVISAAYGHFELALAREIMAEPSGFVEVDADGGHDDGFTAMGFEVGALAVNAFVAGGGGDLVVPADERGEGVVELLRGEGGGIAGGNRLAVRITVVGFGAPLNGGVIGFGDGVEIFK